jgi:signal transduction histidine kinase/DNA-binding response OmpR family regulator
VTSEITQDAVLPLEDFPFIENVIQSSRPIVLQADPSLPNETGGQRLFADPRQYMQKTGLRTLVLIPLSVKAQTIGVVELQAQSLMINPTPGQLNLVMTIANAAAIALENASLYEQQLRTAEQLREVDKLKSQFLANMSHELRTPLNSIIGFSRVILKGIDGPIGELQQQDLTAIHNAGTHLLQLINDVLDISKIEAGKMELAFDDSVNIADLVNSAMSTAIGLTKDKPIRLERHIDPNIPLVRADATRIRQVLINFLSNAAKFTEEGIISVSVTNSISPDGVPEILVSVTDTGPGISLQDQARLFQPFTQVDSSPTRKVGGTGLGLSISRLLIELHNGRIGVNSDVGKGSTFYFSIPMSSENRPKPPGGGQTGPLVAPPGIAIGAAQEPVKTGTLGQGPRKILIIDDDRQVINLYERYLLNLGYQTFGQVDPWQAVETARLIRPFAITLDIMMPAKDGWQVLQELKSDHATRNIPVIICSIVADQEKAFSLGAVDYLSKPILEEDLARSLDQLNGDGRIHDVLVIDDDVNSLELVRKSLAANKNYQVRTAKGGVEGLVAIQTKPPQAVILDLFMPDIDGFAILETIRQEPATQEIPVIVFSAADLTEENRARISEFTEHMLSKSTAKEGDLLKIIEDVLRRLKGSASPEGSPGEGHSEEPTGQGRQ